MNTIIIVYSQQKQNQRNEAFILFWIWLAPLDSQFPRNVFGATNDNSDDDIVQFTVNGSEPKINVGTQNGEPKENRTNSSIKEIKIVRAMLNRERWKKKNN